MQDTTKSTSKSLWSRLVAFYAHNTLYFGLYVTCAAFIGLLIIVMVVLILTHTLPNLHKRLFYRDFGFNGYNISGQGEGTFYSPRMALGACGWDNDEDDYVAAINHVQYGNFTPSKDSPVCGACLLVYGPKGSVQVKAVDLCPECSKGDLDLSPAAFDKIADADVGRVPIVWKGC